MLRGDWAGATDVVTRAQEAFEASGDRLGYWLAQTHRALCRIGVGQFPEERAVAQAIASHRFRDQVVPQTLEAKVLYDADKLDAIGAIGIARAYALAGRRGQHLWAETPAGSLDESQSTDYTPVHEFTFKLSRLKEALFTTTARQIAKDRHRYMVEFFARLEAEVQGKR